MFATLETLLFYLRVGLVNALILSIWAKYNQIRHGGDERRKSIPVLKDSQLISSFDISSQMLDIFHNNQIVTVLHDESGRISDVAVGAVTRAQAGRPGLVEPVEFAPMSTGSASASL
ncbi:MAG: poly-beta-1,6-N-acetyl-D-glucosamine biosynthesis protein PgaD [Giesbergeria sp.]